MNDCRVCGGTEFYKEAGYFFCSECQTQHEDKREEILELRLDGTRVTKRKIRKEKSEKIDESVQWTTWEQYNFILIGLTDELIELGVTPGLKITVLQLWAFYLGKAEVAFTSTEKKKVPKLARSFHKKDADIIYGKLKSRKRKRRKLTSNSSVVSSQLSEASSLRELNRRKRLMINEEYNRLTSTQASDSDALSLVSQSLQSVGSANSNSSIPVERLKYSNHAKKEFKRMKKLSKKLPMSKRSKYQQKHVTTKYRTSPHVITPMKLWAILYLALRIHKQDIHLADMLRYGREGHLSYYRLDHLLPAEMTITDSDVKLLTQNNEITHKGMRKTSAEIAKFLFVREIRCPNLVTLIKRYCKELNLPEKISTYVESLVVLSAPRMIFNNQEPLIPNYEGRAMAFIVVVLKVLLGMDGITEYETSRIAEKINRIAKSINERNISSPNKSGNVCIIVHGGCGQCSDSIVCEKLDGCKKAASLGYKKMMDGGNALDAVEAALWWLECDESFNCGYGSVLNQLGEVQMDASIMDGDRLEIGSLAAVSDIEHPINLAKFILQNYPNTILVGEGAKKLSKSTDMRLISKGNMVSPKAKLALNLSKNCDPVLKYNVEDLEDADLLKKSWGTTGCVVWDGRSMAAGTTTGGLSGKMAGRIGDSPLLGCGTFANSLAGCSLTGHGETITKLGISRNVVTEIAGGRCPEDALKLCIDSMQSGSNRESGGIVLKKNGCWGVYFTTPRMPYAVVKKNLITYGADLYEKKTNAYFDPETKLAQCRCNKAEAEDYLRSKLFSFREWQRYIECRRNILTRKHFPTKFKNDSDGFGNTELYVRFIKSALSRREDKPEIRNYKNAIPRQLTNAMEQCISMLGESYVSSDDVEIFLPSLTPQYSYLMQLWENPMYDLPDILRNDFSKATLCYSTKPKRLMKFSAKLGIALEIVKSRLHFVEKLVPQFEKSKLPNLGEWNAPVTVEHRNDEVDQVSSTYLEKKDSQRFKLDTVNRFYYDAVQEKQQTIQKNQMPENKTSTVQLGARKYDRDDFDFGFEDVTCDGKLAISSFDDSDSCNESATELNGKNYDKNQTESLNFYKKYNLRLPDYRRTNESDSPDKLNSQAVKISKEKKEFARGVNGRFVAKDSAGAIKGDVVFKNPRKITPWSKEKIRNPHNSKEGSFPSKNDVAFESVDVSFCSSASEKLFIPSEDYWMYHCIFSRVKPKNFECFESELPVSFQWLLNECADVVEMSTEDLYEQVCFVETYFAHVLSPDDSQHKSYDSKDNQTKIRLCAKKW